MNLYEYVGNNSVNSIDPYGLVDLNLTTWQDPGGRITQILINPQHMYSIGGHGNYSYIHDENENILTPRQLVDRMQKKGDYRLGQTVKLYICETGAGGKDSFAQRLADELANRYQTKVKVIAPDKYFVTRGLGLIQQIRGGTYDSKKGNIKIDPKDVGEWMSYESMPMSMERIQ
jgi:hypothetical protein